MWRMLIDQRDACGTFARWQERQHGLWGALDLVDKQILQACHLWCLAADSNRSASAPALRLLALQRMPCLRA